MHGRTVSKLNDRVAELLPRAELPPEAALLVADASATRTALAALEGGEFLVEAARLIALALPRREAVWWACMCAHHTEPPALPEADRAAVLAAELWVRTQTDESRRAAFAYAEQAGFATPEAWAAVGAFWSGESISPLGQIPVPAPAHMTATAVAGSVTLASVRDFPGRQAERLRRFLASAREIETGGAGHLPAEASQE